MTKLRSNLLTITLDALMMLYINGPSMEQVVELVAADKDPAMASSPTVNLLELCDPDEYGGTNGKKWCIIEPIQRAVEGSDSDVELSF